MDIKGHNTTPNTLKNKHENSLFKIANSIAKAHERIWQRAKKIL